MLSFYFLSAAFNCVGSGTIAALFLLNRSRYKYFILFNLGVCFWSFFYSLWQLSDSYSNALIFTRLLMVGATIIPHVFLFFIAEYLKTLNSNLLNIIKKINYGCIILFLPLLTTSLVIKNLEPILMFKYWPKGGLLFIPYLLYFFFNVVTAHILIFRKYIETKKHNYLIVFICTTIAFLGGSTNYFLWLDILIPPYLNFFVTVYAILMGFLSLRWN